ncbi:PAS domain S-box protein [delta proteobacterium NaphS2]|nr:PAS domain S-box protein [delta proteobacterium NaphS2]
MHFQILENYDTVYPQIHQVCSKKHMVQERTKMADQKKPGSWGHRLREKNNDLKEKIKSLKKENARLKKNLEKAWELMAHVPGGLLLLQQEIIVYGNKAACGWLGYSLAELAGKKLLDIIDPNHAQPIFDFIHGKAANQTPNALQFKNSQGRPVYCAVHIKKTRYKGRKALLLNVIEIEKKIEEQKTLFEREKFKAFQEMAGAIALEFDNTADAAPLLLNALTRYAKKNYQPSELEKLNLDEIIEESVSSYCSSKGIHYGQDPDAENQIIFKSSLNTASTINGSKSDLQTAFTSLVANAAEAIEKPGEIYLTSREDPDMISVYIQENGCGIEEDVADTIFDPFFTTKGGEHKGLGLSLAHAAIERHGGKISVLRHEAGGTTFHVTLPLDRALLKTKDMPKRKSIKDAKILLLGNQNILNNLLCRFLSEKHLNITRSDSYAECFKALKAETFDLFLLDRNKSLSETSWLTRKVHQTSPELAIALFNVSRRNSADLKNTPGIDLLIPKPLHVEEFYANITQLISKGVYRAPLSDQE